jgi:hypothetical protein
MVEPEEAANVYKEYWDAFARAFAHSIQANGLLAKFVRNPNVTGDYAEAWIRSMAKNMLGHRFRISTGAVIRSSDLIRGLNPVPQCDLIVWDPSELPAIFESGEFALVPLFAARAIIEIERTYKDNLPQQLKDRRDLLPAFGPVLGVVIDHPKPLFDQGLCAPDWLENFKHQAGGYDITKDPPITSLLNGGQPDTRGIMAFIYFLAQVAGHTRIAAGLRE